MLDSFWSGVILLSKSLLEVLIWVRMLLSLLSIGLISSFWPLAMPWIILLSYCQKLERWHHHLLFESAFRLILAKVSLIKLCQSLRTIDGHTPWIIDILLSIVSSMLSMDMSWLLAWRLRSLNSNRKWITYPRNRRTRSWIIIGWH